METAATLSREQRMVMKLIKEGQNVFITGSGGTGKSFLIEEIKRYLKESNKTYAVTAPTGTAANNIGGVTLTRWSGFGIDRTVPIDSIVSKIVYSRYKNVRDNWDYTQVLFIDEISMVSKTSFSDLCDLARAVRIKLKSSNADSLFGGIQLVVCGDFYQLPPISKKGEKKEEFCFASEHWAQLFPKENCVVLNKVFRQKDEVFSSILNQIRIGEIDKNVERFMSTLARPFKCPDPRIIPTILYCTNVDVDEVNDKYLEGINSKPEIFRSIDYNPQKQDPASYDKNFLAKKTLYLKVGAQVMFIKNWPDANLVNGSIGIVTGFDRERLSAPIVSFPGNDERGPVINKIIPRMEFKVQEGDVVLASRNQVPLILCCAITVHKAQGMTIPYLKIDISNVFETGQAYVALSRAVSAQYLQVVGFHKSKIKKNKTVEEFYYSIERDLEEEEEDESDDESEKEEVEQKETGDDTEFDHLLDEEIDFEGIPDF